MAENVDHNTITINGKGTLHAMCLCVATTHSENTDINAVPLIKRQKRKLVKTVTEKKNI